MARIKICKAPNCHNSATSAGYCRLHYMINWKSLREEKRQRAAMRLNKYVERMCKQFPDRYVDEIKKDLRAKRLNQLFDDAGLEHTDVDAILSDPAYDEEVENLIRDIKLQRGF